MDSPEELSTVLSLCTGYGGIERGLELAGFEHRVVAHVEIESFAITNLVAKMEAGQLDAAPIWSNLKTLPVDCFRDRVDILTGGYPCQPFSAAGKRKGKDDPRHLWPYIHDIIRAIRPVRCFFENVEGHISLGLREVIEDLEGLNFKTAWGIFSASEVGAPHQRKRVFILANANSSRQLQSQGSESEQWRWTGNSGQEGTMANSDSFSLQGVRSNEHQEGRQRQEEKPTGLCSGTEIWDVEPNVGRVAHGISKRMDRLKGLGNAIVPQLAMQIGLAIKKEIESE